MSSHVSTPASQEPKKGLSENIRKVTIPIHLLAIASTTYLLYSGEYARLLWAVPFWVVFSGLGIAIGYHRLLSHRAFETPTFTKRILALCGVFAGQGSPIFWTATHRGLHHPFSDQQDDPHSPRVSLFHAFIGWQLRFDRSNFNPRHAIDVIRDPFLRALSLHYHKTYWAGVALMFAIDWRFALGSFVPALIMSCHQENIVNTFCHIRGIGYRNFETNDDSNNIWILGVLFWGQALHNNHHRYPKRWNFATKPWEFDPCALIVPLIRTRSLESKPEKEETPVAAPIESHAQTAKGYAR